MLEFLTRIGFPIGLVKYFERRFLFNKYQITYEYHYYGVQISEILD